MKLTQSVEFQTYLKTKNNVIPLKGIEAVLTLKEEGGTVPFIARYRKEKTGNLDEVQIREVLEFSEDFGEIQKRRDFVITEIEKQGQLTDDIKKRLIASWDLAEIEEIYRPYKRKKKTKAALAREAGIEPFTLWILGLAGGEIQETTTLEVKAKEFLAPTKGYATYEEVLRGAQHIIVEKLSNGPELREKVKEDFETNGVIKSQKTPKFKTNSKYEMYAEFSESLKTLKTAKASHRYLALRRGWQEEELKVSIESPHQESLLRLFEKELIKKSGTQAESFLKTCAKTALEVHVIPSITNEIHRQVKDFADIQAINVFAENVKKVLMGSPFGAKVVLGIDPGLKTGCKVALVENSGKFISHTVMDMLGNDAKEKARKLFDEVLKQIEIQAIAVGNGTGGRESEKFIRDVLREIGKEVPVIMVNESGASVYSASDIARTEFPDLDLTVRGAISIARRLQDPLAELVKIEPKSIGVGQYQHDVSQPKLKKSLHDVVESCVNQVGVDVNTASQALLQYVAGIGPAIAQNIVQFRSEKGLFKERSELTKVPQLSSKSFEQAAGFLRVMDGTSPLDKTGIHPERYSAVKEMATDLGVTVSKLMGDGAKALAEKREKWAPLVGEFTFDDIVQELAKPGRDPRDPFKVFQFREDIHELKDLEKEMICPGIVTNVTNFGAFVDIGVHQDGLVHISEISNQFISDPREVVSPGDQVKVKILAVDVDKSQISLSMKFDKPAAKPARSAKPKKKAEHMGAKGKRGKGPKGKPGGHKGQKRGPGGSRPAQKPFNNPFGALGDIKSSS
ncbi:MAG: RNA-binding transcriptional accessory protein [Bdellovibrionales bacterium]|nr:RNA-binding transcriptional accessory protein [Bdellovibrionales bacterium]